MKENKFQKQVKKQLENQGAFIINVHGHRLQIAGLPDLQVIHRKWKGWLELKVEKNEASALQRVQAAKIELRGMPVYVLRCVDLRFTCGNPLGIDYGFEYTLENFQGDVITEINDLNSLLGVLIKLEEEKQNE